MSDEPRVRFPRHLCTGDTGPLSEEAVKNCPLEYAAADVLRQELQAAGRPVVATGCDPGRLVVMQSGPERNPDWLPATYAGWPVECIAKCTITTYG